MTIDFICGVLAELFDSPCNFSPMDEYMFQDEYCEHHCGKVEDKDCWKRYFEKRWADSKVSEKPTSSEKPNNSLDKDTNVRSKEPQIDWHYSKQDGLWYPYKHEDEPLTCSFSDCDNFKNPDYARCIECKRKQIESKTEPQSNILLDAMAEAFGIEDEPQTDDAYSYDEDDWYDKTERNE